MPVDPNQLSQDKDFLAAQPADQIKYLSSQDPDFAKAAPADQYGYLGHVTGKPVSAPPNAGLPGVPLPPGVSSQGAPPKDITQLASKQIDLGDEIPDTNMRQYGADTPVLQQLKDAAKPVALGAATMAPILSAGASLPVQAAVGAASGAAQSKLQGGSNKEAAVSGAVGGALPYAGEGISRLVGAAKNYLAPAANVVKDTYSPEGDAIAASLRSNARVDVPAEAANAHKAIEEGLADRGFSAKDFQGRNGPQALQSGIDNALDIQEARAKSVIDPVRGEKVDPQVLAQNPELAARFPGKSDVTYGDLDAERMKMNKELRRANFYSKDPSAQYAVADPLADTHEAVNQARDLVYGKAQDATGVDLRPLKQTESSLIKLGDLAETTKNSLVAKDAVHAQTSGGAKLLGTAKSLLGAKMNPLGVLSSYEPTVGSPLDGFNKNMKSAFQYLEPATADRTLPFPRYNLNLSPPPPGEVGPTPAQNILNFSKEAHPEPSPTQLPPSSIRQKLLSAAQPEATPLPRSLGAAAAQPAPIEIPQTLRDAAGLNKPLIAPDIGKWQPPPELGVFSDSADVGAKARAALEDKTGPLVRDTERRAIPRIGQEADDELFAQARKELGENASTDDIVQRMGELKTRIATGGHAGNGVASVEELNRPGSNYVVSKQGKLTYHGKAFAPESTPNGSAHVTVMSDGKFRVNEGNLTPQMEQALKNGLKK